MYIRLQLSSTLGQPVSPLFQVTDSKGEDVIEKVVGWINSAKVVQGDLNSGYGHSPVIMIYDKTYDITGLNGRYVRVSLVFKHIGLVPPYGGYEPIKNEMVVSQPDRGSYRIYSPDLYNWFLGGWVKDK